MSKKRILTALLAAALVIGSAACGGNGAPAEESGQEASAVSRDALQTEEGTEPGSAEPSETAAPEGATSFKAGFGRADITPQVSVPLEGYGNVEGRRSDGYLDPIYADCIALEDENGELALLYFIDMLAINAGETSSVRANAASALGVKKELVHVSCTHSHAAPALLNTGTNMGIYLPYFYAQLLQAAEDAVADLKPCTASMGTAEVSGLNFVRHVRKADGTYAGPNFGSLTTGTLVGYETEADHSARFLRFEREGARDILLCNFQVHATMTGGFRLLNVSADVPGQLRADIEAGEDVYCAYMQGGAGNVNPTSYIKGDSKAGSYKQWGKLFYGQVKETLRQGMTPVQLGPIKTAGLVKYEGRVNHSEDGKFNLCVQIKNEFLSTGHTSKSSQMAQNGIHSVYHAINIVKKASYGATKTLDISAMSFGDVGLFTAPYEMFDVNAKYVRDHSPFALTLCMAYCDDYQSYLAADYSYDNGCYEADVCFFEKGTAELLAQEFAGMLTALKEAPEPTERVTRRTSAREDEFAGLTWDGKFYYNYNRTLYNGLESAVRPRTAEGCYDILMLTAEGQPETVTLKGKALCLAADRNDVVCLWRDGSGAVRAVSGPEQAGCSAVRALYVKEQDCSTLILNSAHGLDGVTTSLLLPVNDPPALVLVPDARATKSAGTADRLRGMDRVTAVLDGKGCVKALFILSRETAAKK